MISTPFVIQMRNHYWSGVSTYSFVFSIMGPKKDPKLSRFVPLDDTARLPALLSSLTLLGGDSIQELDEGSNDNPERSTEVLAQIDYSRSVTLNSILSLRSFCKYRRKPLHQ